MKELGIMGGTFNPIRTRQLLVGQCALEQFFLDKILYVPNGEAPHKRTDVLDKELRFEMVAAAVADHPQFEASRIEIDRPGITWTIDTLQELRTTHGEGVRLNFIIGEDNIKSLQGYSRRAEFLKLCRLLVAPRETVADKDKLLAQWRQALPEADIEMIDCPSDASSSTLVREWIRKGWSVRYLVHPAVFAILQAKQHYVVKAEAPAVAVVPSSVEPPAPSAQSSDAAGNSAVDGTPAPTKAA